MSKATTPEAPPPLPVPLHRRAVAWCDRLPSARAALAALMPWAYLGALALAMAAIVARPAPSRHPESQGYPRHSAVCSQCRRLFWVSAPAGPGVSFACNYGDGGTLRWNRCECHGR